jgi:hypothetical protein
MKLRNLFGLMVAGTLVLASCKKDDNGGGGGNNNNTTPAITSLSCATATISDEAVAQSVYSGTATVPYTGGNGATYSNGSGVASTGVTGLTATLVGDVLASGNGNAVFTISGTPATAGTASFDISLGGQSCTLNLTVNAPLPHVGKWFYDKAYDSAFCCLTRLRNQQPLEFYPDSSGYEYESNGNLQFYLDLKANNSFTELFIDNSTYNGNYVRNGDSLRLNYVGINYVQRNKVTLENATDMHFYYPRNSYSLGSRYSIIDNNGQADTLIRRFAYMMKK